MEDSYTVHRRRKAAARKREKTPDPPRLNEDVSDDEETRARMERMVEDTEKMEKREEVERSEMEPRRPTRKASLREDQGGSGTEKHESKVSTPRKSDLNVEELSENRADTKETRDNDAREAARSSVISKDVSREMEKEKEKEETEETEETTKNEKEKKSKEETEPDERARSTLIVTENSGESIKMAECRRNDEKSVVKKRSKERSAESRRSYTTDSSDGDDRDKGSSSRRKKSPEIFRSRSGGGRKPAGRSRRMTDSDEDEDLDTSRTDSFTERSSRSARERRSSGKHRYSIGTDEDSGPRKNDSFVEVDQQTRRREEKAKIRDKRSTSRHKCPSDTDEEPKTMMMKKSETFPQRTTEKSPIRRSASEVKKQIIPLSNDSLIQDFAKAQQEYLRKEVGILDPNPDPIEIFYIANEETSLRRRKASVIHVDPKREETAKMVAPTRSWFSWLPFLRKRDKETDENHSRKTVEVVKKDKKRDAEKKVSFLEFLSVLRDAVSEFKAFVEQNPRETRVIRKLRNRCTAELVLMLIYCGLGAFVFRFTEGAFETFYKCGVKRVKRDFLDSLWNYSHNLREDDWKSMARRKLMEFEEQLHTAHEAGVHTYSGQRSWSFLNAVVYCLTVITTIGYGHISPSTTTGRALTILYAIFGIPMFLIILADFGKLFTRGIKFLWAFVRRVYYTGSCRKVRRTVPVQEVMKGVQLVYDFATFRRPSQINPEDIEEMQRQQGNQTQTVLNLDGNMPQPDTPGTPAMSNFAIDDEFNLPISVAIFILLVYIFVGATIYYMWEDWGFFESFYFVFISMSTIGFGDYVPQHPIYMMCSIVYLVFGLALTSMCINVVQVMLSDSFKQASQKIGATIGFEVAEDNGSIQAIAPPPVEIADVHMTIKDSTSKEKIAPRAKQEDVDL